MYSRNTQHISFPPRLIIRANLWRYGDMTSGICSEYQQETKRIPWWEDFSCMNCKHYLFEIDNDSIHELKNLLEEIHEYGFWNGDCLGQYTGL